MTLARTNIALQAQYLNSHYPKLYHNVTLCENYDRTNNKKAPKKKVRQIEQKPMLINSVVLEKDKKKLVKS
ncbi:hypothetical protein ALT785_130025 [Alteromonas infernus]